jgi:hypothetical protein
MLIEEETLVVLCRRPWKYQQASYETLRSFFSLVSTISMNDGLI